MLRLGWGSLLLLALCLSALALACLTDWWIDLYRDTPYTLRLSLLIGQSLLLLVGGYFLVIRPVTQRLSNATLARWIDEKLSVFNHRLITVVEFREPGANTDGISSILLDQITNDVAQISTWTDYMAAFDSRRVWRCLWLASGIFATAVLSLLIFPSTLRSLVARQFLSNVDIPRSVYLSPLSSKVHPFGEPIDLQFEVRGGGWSKELTGSIELQMPDGASESHPLVWQQDREAGVATFVAKIPSSSSSFQYRASLGDGRTREIGEVTFESRPSLLGFTASEILPAYCGLRPDGQHYEEMKDKEDIIAFRDSWARISFKANKRLSVATVQLMTTQETDASEKVSREIRFELNEAGTEGQVAFPLQTNEHAYRIVLVDTFGLKNKYLPRRNISFRPEDPPQVQLLPERFPAAGSVALLDDTEVDGIPAVPGRPIRIAYRAQTIRALDRAVLRYRVLPSGVEATPDYPAWSTLPLREWKNDDAEMGEFDLDRGVFSKSEFLDEIEFHAIPSPAKDLVRGRREGGGRFDLKTNAIPGLQTGSQIEYYIEVYDRKEGSSPGTSEIRIKEVYSPIQFTGWIRQKRDESRRLTELQRLQEDQYDPTRPTRRDNPR